MTITAGRNSRPPYGTLPAPVRAEIEGVLGSRVVAAATQEGGFSPAVAARLKLADGTGAFVKAVGPDVNPDSPGIYRSEAKVAAQLPHTELFPRFLGSVEWEGWVSLLFGDVEGANPPLPWAARDLDRVLDAITRMSRKLTPSPIPVPSAAETLNTTFTGWRQLLAVAEQDERLDGLDAWALSRLDDLAVLEARAASALAGKSLLHLDLRADNMILTGTEVVFVDWPWAAIGPAWADLLFFLPSVTMQGGPRPDPVFRAHPLGRHADPDAVDAVLAGFSGFLVAHSRMPPPPGLPTLRAFQAALGAASVEWLRRRIS
jgi:hypothetical protein